MNIAKKIFAVATSSLMVVASVASFASSAHAAVHATGTNVSSNGTVYFLDGSTKRPYTSAGAFLSYGFNSWSSVVAASPEDLALPTGAFVPPMDGSLINDKGTVYLMTAGQRAGFTSASNFLGLGYSFSNALAGDTSWMTSAALINSTSIAHPAGTLVNQAGTVYLMTATGKQGIPSLAVFNSWGYSFSKVVPANSYDAAVSMSAGIMPTFVAGCLSPLSCGNGTTPIVPVVTGNVSVSAASDMPLAGQTIVAGQAAAVIGNFVFNGTGTVTSLTFNRIGVSTNSAVDNVYLYQGSNRLTDGSSVTASNTVSFNNANGLFNVNGSTEISVRADIDSNSLNIAAGQTIGFQLATGMTGTTAVAGAPVSSNLSSVSIATNLAKAVIAQSGGVTPTTGATVNAGTSNFVVWSSPVAISNHAVTMAGASFEYMGSASVSAFQNWALYLDGAKVATSATGINSNNYVVFTTSTPASLTTGSHTLEVHADIIAGSDRNIQLTLQNGSDLMLTDTNYNVNITPVTGSNTSFVPVSAASVSINQGTLSISLDPSFNTTTNIPAGATSQVVASYQLQSYGENVKINNLTVHPNWTTGPTPSNTGLQNFSVYLNGSQVGSTQNWNGTTDLTFSFGSQLIVPASSTPSILQIKADLQNSSGVNYTAGVLQVNLLAGTSNAQGQTSLQTTSTSSATGQSLTVGGSAGVLAVNTALSNSSILSNTAAQRIGSYTIQAGSAEGLTINSATISFPLDANGSTMSTDANTFVETGTNNGTTFTAAPTFTGNYLNNLKLVVSNCSGSSYTASPVNPQQSNTFSLSCQIAANSTATIDVYADPGNNAGAITTALSMIAQGQSSHNTTTLTVAAAQKMTVGTGSVSEPTLGASAAVSALVASATTPTVGPATTGAFNFVSTTGTSSIQEMWVGVYTNSGVGAGVITATSPVTQITVSGPGTNGTTSAATAPVVNGVAHITGLNIQIPQGNSGQDVSVTPTFNFVGTNGLTTGQIVRLGVTEYKYQAGQSTVDKNEANDSTPYSNEAYSNPMVITAAIPTVVNSNGIVGVSSGATMGAGMQVLQFTVSANASGPIRLKQVAVTPNWAGTLTNAATDMVKIYNVTNPSTILNGGGSGTATAMTSGSQFAIIFSTSEVIAAGTSKTYTVTVDTTGLTATGNSFRLDLSNTSETYAAPATAASNKWAWNDATVGSQGNVSETFMNGYLVQQLPVTGPTFTR